LDYFTDKHSLACVENIFQGVAHYTLETHAIILFMYIFYIYFKNNNTMKIFILETSVNTKGSSPLQGMPQLKRYETSGEQFPRVANRSQTAIFSTDYSTPLLRDEYGRGGGDVRREALALNTVMPKNLGATRIF
jgi:hypothetical protein